MYLVHFVFIPRKGRHGARDLELEIRAKGWGGGKGLGERHFC